MFAILSILRALEYIEANIHAPFTPQQVADYAFLSLSQLNRSFARAFGCPPAEYIRKRRLCVAARQLAKTERTILDIALDAQFSAAESFARAFKKQFLVSPSRYRREGRRFHELYPPLVIATQQEGEIVLFDRKKYNIEELRERILASKGTYALMIDMDHLERLNSTMGMEAGDAALSALFTRIEDALEEGMVLFRTGGDEFTVLTGSKDVELCARVAQKIVGRAGEAVAYPGGTIHVTACVGIGLIPEDTSDPQAALRDADQAMLDAKRAGRNLYRVFDASGA